jgi:hypothetical protein
MITDKEAEKLIKAFLNTHGIASDNVDICVAITESKQMERYAEMIAKANQPERIGRVIDKSSAVPTNVHTFCETCGHWTEHTSVNDGTSFATAMYKCTTKSCSGATPLSTFIYASRK